jgi:hypothetical protein
MNAEERIKQIETEFSSLSKDLKQVLLDIRIFLMEANSPLRDELNNRKEHCNQDNSSSDEEIIHGN